MRLAESQVHRSTQLGSIRANTPVHANSWESTFKCRLGSQQVGVLTLPNLPRAARSPCEPMFDSVWMPAVSTTVHSLAH